MGIAVSNWTLARAVASLGQLGVVSGTALDTVFVRRLQDGDPGGHARRAMSNFPVPSVVEHVLKTYFRSEGRADGEKYRLLPLYKKKVSTLRDQITALAAYVEVTLAREGHDGMIGMNLLTKIQMPTLATLYGAMLAGVDVILMGAGIPKEIPGALDTLARHESTQIKFDVIGVASGEVEYLTLEPTEINPGASAPLHRPLFYPIVSAASLALNLARKASGRVDGFIVEGPTAGGHNAPPRGALKLDANGEPIYGERDVVDLSAMRDIGLPFWLAGGSGSPEALAAARAEGAQGIQVGTLFAFCDESGFTREIKDTVIDGALHQSLAVRTDIRASPTGYPFKLVRSSRAPDTAPKRERLCDLGYLREAVRQPDGTMDYRCASEPVKLYTSKGGTVEETADRQCLCNALCACIGEPQVRDDGSLEPILVTSGDDVLNLDRFLNGRTRYSAADVLEHLLKDVPVPAAAGAAGAAAAT